VQDRGERLFDVPLLVGIVDPQDELPSVPPGEEPAEQRGPHSANMQVSGRTRCEAGANCHFGLFGLRSIGESPIISAMPRTVHTSLQYLSFRQAKLGEGATYSSLPERRNGERISPVVIRRRL
jgi:hypothetical protein